MNLTLQLTSTAALRALADLIDHNPAGFQLVSATPPKADLPKEAAPPVGKPSPATPAPSPRTAAPTPRGAAPAAPAQKPPGGSTTETAAGASSAADDTTQQVKPEDVSKLILTGFVPTHKQEALDILATFRVQRGKDLTDEQRPAAYAALVAKAKELGITVPALGA